jgi:hypothetical protein
MYFKWTQNYFLFPNTGLDSKDSVGLIVNPDENKSSEYTWAPIKCETKSKRNEINEMKTKPMKTKRNRKWKKK